MNYMAFFLLACFIISCTSTKEASRSMSIGEVANQSELTSSIAHAKTLYEMGDIDAAISNIKTLIDRSRYSKDLDKAYELLIEWLVLTTQDNEAERLATYFLQHYPNSPSAEKIIGFFDNKKKENKEPDPLESTIPQPKIEEQKIPEPPTKSQGLDIKDHALYHFHLGELAQAQKYILEALPLLANNEQASLVELKHKIDALKEANPQNIGVLLPLSGPFASFAKRALLAICTALDIPYRHLNEDLSILKGDFINLIVADSKGETKQAQKMIEELSINHAVSAVIGDIINDSGLAAAQICHQYHIPMLHLLKHPLLSNLGAEIFQFNVSSKYQIEALVKYSINTLGYRRFAILYPKHNYGISAMNDFFTAAIANGAEFRGIESYDANLTTFTEPISKLIGTYHKNAHKDYINCSAYEKDCELKPLVDFDAIFIPEFSSLAYIVPALTQADILITNNPTAINTFKLALKNDNAQYVKLLGSSSWNDSNLITKLSNQIDGAFFVDSYNFDQSEGFIHLKNTFEQHGFDSPKLLEVLAFDAAKLLSFLLINNQHIKKNELREHLLDKLMNYNGRIALIENISFSKNRELIIPLFGYEIKAGQSTARRMSVEP